MTSREKVLEAERQVRLIVKGELAELDCPFCGLGTSVKTHVLCCDAIADVASAVMDHMDHLERCENVERMFDRLEKMDSAVLN